MSRHRSRPLRVLMIAHNHPKLHPGGAEIFAHDLFTALKAEPGIEALFLACTNQVHRQRRPGTVFQTVGSSADEIVLWAGHFDRFYQSQVDLHGVVPELAELLRDFAPDVVHFHHTLLLGVEMIFLVRRLLPRARIVFTLHDYFPICAHEGQMVKTGSRALCHGASPDACHACFPEVGPDRFKLRETHLKNLLSLVDRFVAPSRFLRRRFVEWGLPADRLSVVPNGRPAVRRRPSRATVDGRRNVFGYFGNLSPFKGILVALKAASQLVESGDDDFSLIVHGGMPFQTDAFRDEVERLADRLTHRVSLRGPYARADQASLIAEVDWVVVPSIWWENAPLVIQEAFQHGRPAIVSDIGGMAEAVRRGVDGLHFRVGDPTSLAATMRRAMTEPGIFQRFAENIPSVPTIAETAGAYRRLYANDLSASEAGSTAQEAGHAG